MQCSLKILKNFSYFKKEFINEKSFLLNKLKINKLKIKMENNISQKNFK